MDNFWKQYYRMCLSTINKNSEEILNITEEHLDILLTMLDLDKNKQLVCEVCVLTVMELLKFKSIFVHTDNTIIHYVDDETGNSVELLKIYAKKRENNQLMDTLCDHKVCRLCMQLVQSKFMSKNKVETDAIETYIPEFKISVNENPVICRGCNESIGTHSSFIKNCLEVEEKIRSFYNDKGSYSPSWIPVYDLSIKIEDNAIKQELEEYKEECMKTKYTLETLKREDQYQLKAECIDIKLEKYSESEADPIFEDESFDCINQSNSSQNSAEEDNDKYPLYEHTSTLAHHQIISHENQCDTHVYKTEGKDKLESHRSDFETKLFECDTCGFKTRQKTHLKMHMLRHKNISEIEMFKCDTCPFKTKFKSCVKRHMLIHKDISERKLYECDTCHFKTSYSSELKKHMLKHKEIPTMFECNICNFKTKCKRSLKYHMLRHKDISEMEAFKCDTCGFKTRHKAAIRKHVLTHKNYSETEVYTCDACTYKCNQKRYLKVHLLKHKDFSETETFECDTCDYKTKYKNNFKKHQVKHKDVSEVKNFECDACDYKTGFKGDIKRHMLRHKDFSEAEVFTCDKCDYKTKYKSTFQKHQLIHKDISEIELFTCDTCGYKTKYKGTIKQHMLKHKDFSETEVFTCDTCDYKTKYKSYLKRHQLAHSDICKYNCDTCDYKTNRKGYLKMHLLKRPTHYASCTKT